MNISSNSSITIPGTSITTTDIGFGTSRLMGSALTNKGRLDLLEFVYDQGITHFDTAPLYGWGKAEVLLGKFVRNKRESVSLTTKYGLSPNILPWQYRLAAPIGRLISNNSKSIKKVIAQLIERKYVGPAHRNKSPHPGIGTPSQENKNSYSKQDLESKLDQSLAKLNTDYIDFYLLHECLTADVNEELIQALNALKQAGKIKSYGLATNKISTLDILQSNPSFKGVVQIHHSILGQDQAIFDCSNNQLTITHSVLKDSLRLLSDYLSATADSMARYSDLLDFDLAKPGALVELILSIAARQNLKGIKVFSSQNKQNIMATMNMFKQPIVDQGRCKALLNELRLYNKENKT